MTLGTCLLILFVWFLFFSIFRWKTNILQSKIIRQSQSLFCWQKICIDSIFAVLYSPLLSFHWWIRDTHRTIIGLVIDSKFAFSLVGMQFFCCCLSARILFSLFNLFLGHNPKLVSASLKQKFYSFGYKPFVFDRHLLFSLNPLPKIFRMQILRPFIFISKVKMLIYNFSASTNLAHWKQK